MKNKNYWEGRNAGVNFLSSIRKSIINSGLIDFFYPFLSIRIGDERFIKRNLNGLKVNTVLDIACGAGKDVLVQNAKSCIGVDIEGYPTELVLKRGYKQALVYNAPDYFFEIDTKPDIITSINLNAHLPFSAFEKILTSALKICTKEANVILVNEYLGGYSYENHFLNTASRDALVNVMEHYYFEDEGSFMKKFSASFPNLELVERAPLTSIVSSIQYKYYYFKAKKVPNFVYYIADLFLSIWNYVKIIFGKKSQSAFLVGYVFKVKS